MTHREQAIGASDDWYTPARVFEALGTTFDLDVAAPPEGPGQWTGDERIIPFADEAEAFAWAQENFARAPEWPEGNNDA